METCRLTINIVVHNRLDVTKPCVESLYANTTEPFVLQIIDNASSDGTWNYLEELASRHSNARVIRKRRNLGFPVRQNEMANAVKTPYLCVLNNDVVVGAGWQEPLIEALERNPRLAQVGPSGPSIPVHLGGFWPGKAEYIEGWCFIIPRRILDKFILFSQDYHFGYFEDTDLSLRLQEAGYRIAAIPVPIAHKHSATRQVCEQDVTGYEIRNRLIFQNRWRTYLGRRSFGYRCKIIRPAAYGDVLMLTPALRALREKWPHAFIAVETGCPEVLLHNPCVNQILPMGSDHRDDWDFVWDLTDFPENHPGEPPIKAYCEALGVSAETLRPEFAIHDWDRAQANSLIPKEPFAVFHTGKSWSTKMWSIDRFKSLALMLQENLCLRIVEVGNGETCKLWIDYDLRRKLTWQGLGAVLEKASLFVGVDSGPAHIAQIVGTPAVILFGPTEPKLLVHFTHRVRAVRSSNLRCLGCYHLHPPGARYAECFRGDVKCMEDISVARVFDAAKGVLDND